MTDCNILYFQAGGPTAVINASFQGLYEEYKKKNLPGSFYVSPYGVEGILNDKLKRLSDIDSDKIGHMNGSYFGSARKKLPISPLDPEAKKIIEVLKKNHIGYLFVNGGNDTMNTAMLISSYAEYYHSPIVAIGIPKTVDNDLDVTDHTPGYGSGALYISSCITAIRRDDFSYEKGRINIVEVMGRDSGYLAASSYLTEEKKPDFIYVPEVSFDVDVCMKKAISVYEKTGHCLIVVSEGIRDKDGNLISALSKKDEFGNVQMGGVGSYLSSLFASKGYKTRAIELSLIQRASYFLVSPTDYKEAKNCGRQALRLALHNKRGVMVTIERLSSDPYKVRYSYTDLKEVGDHSVSLPLKYINGEKDNINPSFAKYLKPLIS